MDERIEKVSMTRDFKPKERFEEEMVAGKKMSDGKSLAAPDNRSGRILVVDDEVAIRALAEFTLGRLGYEVVGGESASQGIELYREALICGQRFDLVILDLTLPGGIGGKEALKKLIEIDPMVTAIVSSGYAMDATLCRYEDMGFRGVIAKPYEAAELGDTVRAVIAARRREFQEAQL